MYSYARTSNLSLRCFIAFFSFHFANFMSLPKNPLFSLTLYIKNILFLRVIKNKSGQVGRNPKKCCAATVFQRPLFKNKWAESGQNGQISSLQASPKAPKFNQMPTNQLPKVSKPIFSFTKVGRGLTKPLDSFIIRYPQFCSSQPYFDRYVAL